MITIKNIFGHYLIKASSIVLIGSLVANIFNYIFNLVMGRILNTAEFGEVASLMGLFVIISVPSGTLVSLMAKYTASFKAKKEFSLIGNLFKLINRYSFIIGLVMLFIFLLFTPFLSDFLKIDKLPLFIFSLVLPISLISAVNRGTLQGLQRFVPFSLISIIASIVKLILAIIFVILGFSVSGVITALVIGIFISYLYGIIGVKSYLTIIAPLLQKEIKSQVIWKEISSYVPIIFWTILFLSLFINVDVVLAKHYLSPDLAGQYAVLSLTGKIIFYGSAAFVTVMFPMVSAARANGDGKEKKLLKISFLTISGVASFILILFALFPQFVIKILFGSKYLSIAPYLGWFGLAMLFSALAQVLISYYLAIHGRKYLYPLALIVVLQFFLIFFFHTSIFQITLAMLASSFLILLAMTMVYFRQNLKIKKYYEYF